MTQKNDIEKLIDEGKGYDEIESATKAQRSYIRTIAANHRKSNEAGEPPEKGDEPNKESESEPKQENKINDKDKDNEAMDFKNDLDSTGNTGVGNMGDPKTGKEYHKAWVNEKAFECSCGCTLNRTSKFCPNCGVTLDWSGF